MPDAPLPNGCVHGSKNCAPYHSVWFVQLASEKTASAELPWGPHCWTHVAPSAAHALLHVVLGEMHPERNVPAHDPFVHFLPLLHAAHAPPPVPHALSAVPARQVLPLQHPAHDVKSQTHAPPEQ
jgi:hypothetical protein